MNALLHHFISVQKIPVQKRFLGSCSGKETTILRHFSDVQIKLFSNERNLKTVAFLSRKIPKELRRMGMTEILHLQLVHKVN